MKPISGKASLSVLLGAAFLMATSSIGPGFMLQTAAFTNDLKADFAFAIIVSVIFSIIAQLNVWTIIGISKIARTWLFRSILDFSWRPCFQYR